MKNLFLITLILIVFTSCRKEEEIIKKNLYNRKGEWKITSFESIRTSDFNTAGNFTKTINNPGDAEFNEDGTGVMIYSSEMKQFLNDISYTEIIDAPFDYYLTDKSLFLIYGDSDGLGFDLEWEKNKISFGRTEIKETIVNDGNNNPVLETVTFSIQFNCEKK